MIPLIGYTDRLSARPGETVSVKVSSTSEEPYDANFVRIICGDPNPDGPGMIFEPVSADFGGTYPSRSQATQLGSRMIAALREPLPSQLSISANIWPTTPGKGRQGVMTLLDDTGVPVMALCVGPNGAEVVYGETHLSVGHAFVPWRWYRVWVRYDTADGTLAVGMRSIADDNDDHSASLTDLVTKPPSASHLLVAALSETDTATHFNGKIEAPALHEGTLPLATWDFSVNMASNTIPGDGLLAGDGVLYGAPMRAMTGANWDGTEMNWRDAPHQYGAIHFHDDDIADCEWETDFEATIPTETPSGVYGIRLTCGDAWECLPLFIAPPLGTHTADLCVVIPTFTYVIYANQARGDFGPHWRERANAWGSFPYNPADYPDYGLSTYNDHADGSGIGHSTWRRPILNMRPGYHPFADVASGSGLRHFPADTHLIAWLEHLSIPYDVVTDHDLHAEGPDLLRRYKTVLTGSHPEYHTTQSLDAFQGYRDRGGNLIYLGGNGFYWRVALHPEMDGLIEVRRAEGGLRAWEAQPGEYYHAANGEYGGLWRRNGRPPNRLVGVGYTCQGDFEGTHYRRTDASKSTDLAWMFDGIDDDILGDFGFCGGGAAGYELDRADIRLGTPENAIIIASSENHPDHFVMPPEEWLTHVKTVAGSTPEDIIRADMTYFETRSGGAVFSVGSITFCGSLPWNNYDNNISRLLENVVRRFIA